MIRTIAIGFLLALLVAMPARAQNFQRGLAAYELDDYETALKEFALLAHRGLAKAQHNLGLMYQNGHGLKRDDAKAVQWYRRAARQGYAPAQNKLGVMYRRGLAVSKDYGLAVKWYLRAAAQGYAIAQYNLGFMYDNGWGVKRDDATAIKLFRLAAAQGYAPAQNNLGVKHHRGEGVPRDDDEAVKWYLRAARQDYALAQFRCTAGAWACPRTGTRPRSGIARRPGRAMPMPKAGSAGCMPRAKGCRAMTGKR